MALILLLHKYPVSTGSSPMFARLSHAARHRLPIASSSSFITQSLIRPTVFAFKMSATGDRTIKTAACLIIGDEVLGGKV